MSYAKFSPKPPTTQIDELEFSDRLRRMKRAYDKAGLTFRTYREPSDDIETVKAIHAMQRELLTIKYAKKFPDGVFKNISWFYRFLLPKPSMFESDNGELDSQHKVRQVLVYALNEYVDSPDLENGPIGYQCKMGWYPSPLTRNKRDPKKDEFIPHQVGVKNVFYIEYTPETIDKILNEMSNQPSGYGVAVARVTGPEIREHPYTVFNLREFKEIQDIEGLINASRLGYLQNEYGGYNEFVDAKEDAKKASRPMKPRQNKE